MKHKILPIFLLTITSHLFGQDFGTIGTQWYYSENAQGACPGNCEYLHLQSVLDTVINGQTTHKILSTYYRKWGDTMHFDPIYIYEQSDTVFMWSFPKSKFLITYIFNGNIGDTLILDAPDTMTWTGSTYRLVIDTITIVTIDGIPLKKFWTTSLDYYTFWSEGFMERIGGLDWFFPRAVIIPEAGGPIRCYSDADIDTNFQTVSCDHIIYVSVDELTYSNDIEIYPNPTSNTITVKSRQSIQKIELYDMTGKLLITTKQTVDFSDFAIGQYILTVHLTTGQKIQKKIMKNAR